MDRVTVRKYDDSQARADDGKWTDGGGGGGSGGSDTGSGGSGSGDRDVDAALKDEKFTSEHRDRLEAAGASASQSLKFQGKPSTGPEADAYRSKLVAQEAKNIVDEKWAAESGRLRDLPSKKLEAFEASKSDIASTLTSARTDLDSLNQEAIFAIDDLNNSIDDDDDIAGDIDIADELYQTANSIDETIGGESKEYERRTDSNDAVDDPGELEFDDDLDEAPEADDYDSDDEYKEAVKDHEADVQARDAQTKAHEQKIKEYEEWKSARSDKREEGIERARAALERLHEKQTEYATSLAAAQKAHDKAHKDMVDEIDDYDEDSAEDLVDDKASEDDDDDTFDRAKGAALRVASRESDRRSKIEPIDLDDVRDSLKSSMKSTADSLKKLGKTKAKAKPKKTGKAKKSYNGPDAPHDATVDGMPAHTQLRIKSLKFISAVDRGAQGPISNVALIKRAPTGDEIEAVCKVAGVDEKLGLVFGWALATTLDGGATPHVDLQNDAVVGGDELIKVAADFMQDAAASDVLHDNQPDGKIVFMLPLVPDVCKALGIQTDTHGLAIAMKPSAETFKRFVAKELNAFSIGGYGERTTVDKAGPAPTPSKTRKRKGKKMPPGLYKRVLKNAVLTSETDGHQHSIDLTDPVDGWSDQLMTSYQTSTGAESGHSHVWVYDATTGAITVALDSGHTHTVTAVVPADVIAEAAADDPEERCCSGCGYACTPHDAYCPRCGAKAGCDSSVKPASVTVSIAARATDATTGNSPQPTPTPTVKSQEPSMPTEQELTTENANLRKMLAASLALTEPQRLHVAKLSTDAVPTFLNADPTQREAMIKTAADADPEVYKTAGGVSIRKSDGAAAFALAKQADEQALVIKSQSEALAIQKAAAEQTAFEKRATADLSHFAKSLDIRSLIVKAIDLVPATDDQRKEAHEALKGANKAMQLLGKAAGGDDDSKAEDKDDPKKKLDEMAKKHATENKMTFAKAYTEVLGTAEGAALYEQLNTTPALRVVQ